MKKISRIVLLLLFLVCGAIPVEAGQRAKQDVDYTITYQYFNVYEEQYIGTRYQAIIEIQNTSTGNLYLKSAVFDIYDMSGNIVASEDYISEDPSVIAPGEKGYFYTNGSSSLDIPKDKYTLNPTIKVEHTNLPVKKYPVSGTSIKESRYGGVKIVGTVTNDSSEDESLLWMVFVLFDSENNPIGIYGTNVLDLDAGMTIGFEGNGMFLPDYITLDKVDRYEVIASPIQYQF